ncbi:MAG TPA: hypothetical protein VGM53_00835 [Streptosporangiaceae bacterium]
MTVNDFGKQKQYGRYVKGYYYTVLDGNGLEYDPDFRQILNYNPCPATVPRRRLSRRPATSVR